ncbi:Uncharacterized protein DAT39_000319 [Clarias magur]|uniref:Uncharacterized protein n=1 Tax=Clarias magur TaxID=1594786 RepID=A0A8J5C9N1_CLAMG|nr:Uncharacterized protein DAT39_000319 [Clarias magur]
MRLHSYLIPHCATQHRQARQRFKRNYKFPVPVEHIFAFPSESFHLSSSAKTQQGPKAQTGQHGS